MRRATLIVSLVVVLVLVIGVMAVAADSNRNFRTHLNGANERPIVQTLAQGQAIFQLSNDGTTLHYKLIVANIENVFMAHIHLLAPNSETGPIAVWLYPGTVNPPTPVPPDSWIEGRFSGVLAEGDITTGDFVGPLAGKSMTDLLNAISTGAAYVNVHTNDFVGSPNTGPGDFPAGEVRGHIH